MSLNQILWISLIAVATSVTSKQEARAQAFRNGASTVLYSKTTQGPFGEAVTEVSAYNGVITVHQVTPNQLGDYESTKVFTDQALTVDESVPSIFGPQPTHRVYAWRSSFNIENQTPYGIYSLQFSSTGGAILVSETSPRAAGTDQFTLNISASSGVRVSGNYADRLGYRHVIQGAFGWSDPSIISVLDRIVACAAAHPQQTFFELVYGQLNPTAISDTVVTNANEGNGTPTLPSNGFNPSLGTPGPVFPPVQPLQPISVGGATYANFDDLSFALNNAFRSLTQGLASTELGNGSIDPCYDPGYRNGRCYVFNSAPPQDFRQKAQRFQTLLNYLQNILPSDPSYQRAQAALVKLPANIVFATHYGATDGFGGTIEMYIDSFNVHD